MKNGCFDKQQKVIFLDLKKQRRNREALAQEFAKAEPTIIQRRMDAQDTFYIIDGHSMIYRAIYSQTADLRAKDGEPTKGTYVFTTMLMKMCRERKPNYLAMAVDGPRHLLRRRQMFPGYKSKRKDVSDDIRIQLKRCRQIARKLGIPVYKALGYEADDVIATLVDQCVSDEVRCVIVSRDKDMHQLLGPNVSMYDPTTNEETHAEDVIKRWGVPPRKVVEVQTLSGDPTDGVPGVKGIGDEIAKQLVKTYGCVSEVLNHADDLEPRIAHALGRADIGLARKLVELDRNVPITINHEDLAFDGLDLDNVQSLFRRLGFARFLTGRGK